MISGTSKRKLAEEYRRGPKFRVSPNENAFPVVCETHFSRFHNAAQTSARLSGNHLELNRLDFAETVLPRPSAGTRAGLILPVLNRGRPPGIEIPG